MIQVDGMVKSLFIRPKRRVQSYGAAALLDFLPNWIRAQALHPVGSWWLKAANGSLPIPH